MSTLRFLTSGESHGKALSGVIEGIPSGLFLSSDDIDLELMRRQKGYGRGGRMQIESDHAELLSGVRHGKTLGSPISLLIENKDWVNWKNIMGSELKIESSELEKLVTHPRPGHADLPGAIKYDHYDIRNILERSSARETAMRVALGAIAKKFLLEFDIRIGSYVIQIGSQKSEVGRQNRKKVLKPRGAGVGKSSENPGNSAYLSALFEQAEKSSVRCPDKKASEEMIKLIDKASKEGDSLGGIFEVFIAGVPVGLGSYIQWDKRMDGRLAQSLMSIQAIKGVEVGLGFEAGGRLGSEVMDEIFHDKKTKGFFRKTNNSGGIEGGMTNGMPIIIRAAMKPIPTLKKALRSVDIITKEPFRAAYERSDICAVPAAAVIGEAMAALVTADAFLEKFGGDSVAETRRNYNSYREYVMRF